MAITPGGRVGDASPLGKKGGPRKLDDYVREVAHALMRKGHSKRQAIRIARGVIAKAGATGKWGGKRGRVSGKVQAAAVAATAHQHVLDHVKTGRRR